MGWSQTGLSDVASAIKDMLSSKSIVISLYSATEKVKTLSPTISVVGATVNIHAEDSSTDKYTVNDVKVETQAGELLVDLPCADTTKDTQDKLIVDVNITVSGA